MNKYLLLRDNKQSGPYTVADLVAKGIKAYDLVWLEGKSAAWRYPSEIDELKAYAPAVEEQPYDRFYKKPEAENEKKSFRPVIVEKPALPEIDGSSKRVYINFPGTQSKIPVLAIGSTSAIQSKESPAMETPIPAHKEDAVIPIIAEIIPAQATSSWSSENTMAGQPMKKTDAPHAVTRISDRKLFYGVVTAFFALIMIISILIINYGNQRSSIRELNNMVQQMEKRQNEQNQSAREALAKRVIPVAREYPADQSNVGADLSDASERSRANTASLPPVTSSAPSKATPSDPVSPRLNPPNLAPNANGSPTSTTIAKDQAIISARQPSSPSDDKVSGDNLRDQVSVKPNKFRTGLFGGIVNLQFVLTNNSTRELRRVSVEIKYFSPEKKLVKTQTVYFENVAPNSQPVLDVPKTSRGVTIDYTITHIES